MDQQDHVPGPLRRTRRRAALEHTVIRNSTRRRHEPAPVTSTAERAVDSAEINQQHLLPTTTTTTPSTHSIASELFRQMRDEGYLLRYSDVVPQNNQLPNDTVIGQAVHSTGQSGSLRVPADVTSSGMPQNFQPDRLPAFQSNVTNTMGTTPTRGPIIPAAASGGPSGSTTDPITFLPVPGLVPATQRMTGPTAAVHTDPPNVSGHLPVPMAGHFSLENPLATALSNVTGGIVPAGGSSHGPTSHTNSGSPPDHLSRRLASLLSSSTSLQTRKTYGRAYQLFQKFLIDNNHNATIIPSNVGMLAYFIAHLCEIGLASSTISTYIAAIGFLNKMSGHSDPTQSFIIKKLLTGVQRVSSRADSRLPITPSILEKLVSSLPHVCQTHYQMSLLRAMYLLAFHALLRVGEMAVNKSASHVLQLQDAQLSLKPNGCPSALEITFRSFKGHYNIRPITLLFQSKPHTAATCPVVALHEFLQLRGHDAGPLFCFPNNVPVTYSYFTSCLQSSLAWAGLSHLPYSSHSFRIGAASYAAASGLSDEEIQQMGRWHSLAFKRYIRMPTFYDV
ncbi:uncharacterized protein [Argopecten irradians]|uniref:uncharacterized protein n=1 Tax=Argopecten irradians TaxID=31199 RepID=UPI00371734D5